MNKGRADALLDQRTLQDAGAKQVTTVDRLLANLAVVDLGQLVFNHQRHLLGGLLADLQQRGVNHLLGRRWRPLRLWLAWLLLLGGLAEQHLRQLLCDLLAHIIRHARNRSVLDAPVLGRAHREEQVFHSGVQCLDLDARLAHKGLGALGTDLGQHLGVVLTLVLTQILEPALFCRAAILDGLRKLKQ